jgi:hypothetical protein
MWRGQAVRASAPSRGVCRAARTKSPVVQRVCRAGLGTPSGRSVLALERCSRRVDRTGTLLPRSSASTKLEYTSASLPNRRGNAVSIRSHACSAQSFRLSSKSRRQPLTSPARSGPRGRSERQLCLGVGTRDRRASRGGGPVRLRGLGRRTRISEVTVDEDGRTLTLDGIVIRTHR